MLPITGNSTIDLKINPKTNPLWTLHNCCIFGNLTKNISDASVSQLHFFDEGREATVKNIGDTFGSCLRSYCKQTPPCSITTSPTSLYAYRATLEDAGQNYSIHKGGDGLDLVRGICDNVPARITSDIGGIGVCSPYSVHQ